MIKEKDKVIRALENPRYRWRTIDGVARELKIPEKNVQRAIHDLRTTGKVVKSSALSDKGEELFTTREHFKNSAPLGARFIAALRNRSS